MGGRPGGAPEEISPIISEVTDGYRIQTYLKPQKVKAMNFYDYQNHSSISDEIHPVAKGEMKSDWVSAPSGAVFIDNGFAERLDVRHR